MILCIHAETYFILCWLFLVRNKLCFQNSIWRMFWKRNQKRKEKKRGESLPGIWPSSPHPPGLLLFFSPARGPGNLPRPSNPAARVPPLFSLFAPLTTGARMAVPTPSPTSCRGRVGIGWKQPIPSQLPNPEDSGISCSFAPYKTPKHRSELSFASI